MLALRKEFYGRFATRAKAEGGIPADMAWFIDYIIKWTGNKTNDSDMAQDNNAIPTPKPKPKSKPSTTSSEAAASESP